MSALPFAANSGQYFATLPWRSSSPRSASIRAHSAVIVFVVDQTLTMVSRSQGFVFASSAWPPQMSTTTSPSSTTATDAPTSSPWSKLPANVCLTLSKRGSHVPWTSVMSAPLSSCADPTSAGHDDGVGRIGVAVDVARARRRARRHAAATTRPPTRPTAPSAVHDALRPRRRQLVDRPCDTPASLGPTKCSFLEVPEHRGVAGSRTIKLWVAVATPADAPADATPMIFLPGGPGGDTSSLAMAPDTTWPGGPRPVVYLDPRGIGRSEPDLSCPEVGRPLDASHPWSERRSAVAALARGVSRPARRRRASTSTDTTRSRSQPTSSPSARRSATKVDRVGLQLRRSRRARGARGRIPTASPPSILDSPLTAEPVGPAAKIANDKASTATLAAACAAQPRAASVTPDLSASIDAAIAQADAHPYTAHPTATDGTKVSVLMTGQEVLAGEGDRTRPMRARSACFPSAAKSIAAGETSTLDLIAAQRRRSAAAGRSR